MEERTVFVDNAPVAEATTPAEWVSKLRYSRSFLAKLYLSDKSVKEAYCALCNAFLRYEKVAVKTTFSGVTFSYKRRPICKVNFAGKTLCVCLAVDPALYQEGRYKVKDVSSVKKYALVPSKYKIKSQGGLRFALRLIDALAKDFGLAAREIPLPPASVRDYPSVSFDTLVSRGLIRVIGLKKKEVFSSVAVGSERVIYEGKGGKGGEETTDASDVISDTLASTDELLARHDEYDTVLNGFLNEGEVKFLRCSVVRSVDERWVRAIEDCLPDLDEVTRNPSHFIEETEELLPIERTKKVTTRSIRHLSQHTGLISRIENGVVIPSKLLNVFRDESVMTYENKFVNTLLMRLFDFVTMRYEEAEEFGANRKKYLLSYVDKMEIGEEKGKISFCAEVSVPTEEKEKSRFYQSDLWARVKRLKEVITDYRSSEFATMMGNASIHPPVVRTNPILKNKNLRQCLELWEFLEGYDDDEGGEATAEEELLLTEENERFIKDTLSQQYLLFRHFARLSAPEKSVAREKKDVAKAAPVADVAPVDEEISEDERVFWVDIALRAEALAEEELADEMRAVKEEREEIIEEIASEPVKSSVDDIPVEYPDYEFMEKSVEPTVFDEEEEEKEIGENGETVVLLKSFTTKLEWSDNKLKEYYCVLRNAFLSHKGARVRRAFDHEDFCSGRKTLARLTIVGKTLRVYFALRPAELDAKYNVTDCSEIKKYSAFPALIKIRGPRSLKYAQELIVKVCVGMPVKENPDAVSAEDIKRKSTEESILAGEIRRRIIFATAGKTPLFRPVPAKQGYDYTDEVKEYLKEDAKKDKKGKEIFLYEPLNTTAIGQKLQDVEKEELLAVLPEVPDKPVVTSGPGDPLTLKVEALSEQPVLTELPNTEPEKKPEPERTPVEVPPDGDVLTPKPITLEALGGTEKPKKAVRQEPVREQKTEEKRGGVFSRLFGRRDK